MLTKYLCSVYLMLTVTIRQLSPNNSEIPSYLRVQAAVYYSAIICARQLLNYSLFELKQTNYDNIMKYPWNQWILPIHSEPHPTWFINDFFLFQVSKV